MTLARSNGKPLELRIESGFPRGKVLENGSNRAARASLPFATSSPASPKTEWKLLRNGELAESLRSDDEGKIAFTQSVGPAAPGYFCPVANFKVNLRIGESITVYFSARSA